MNEPTTYEVKRLASVLCNVLEIASGGMNSDLARECFDLAKRVLSGAVPCPTGPVSPLSEVRS